MLTFTARVVKQVVLQAYNMALSLKFATAILLLLIMVVQGMNQCSPGSCIRFVFLEAILDVSFRLSSDGNFSKFFNLMFSGDCQRCEPSKMEIQQTNTGKKIDTLDTVFRVTVTNRCRCAVKNVYLQAPNGFSSSTPVAPKLFRRAGEWLPSRRWPQNS